MKIEKGQKYLCVADIKTENILSGNSYFTKGKIYYSPTDFTLIANDGNGMSLDNNDGIFFQPLSSAKWAIKRTPENAEVVNRWAGSEFCVTPEIFVYHDKLVSFELIDGYTEIDFETFKEITGMGEENPKFQKGDTVVIRQCSKDTYWYADKIGKVFELNAEDSNGYWNIKNKFHLFLDPFDIQKIFTIEDVRNGKCAIENDGTVGELNKVLKACFPNDTVGSEGLHKYFYGVGCKVWDRDNKTDLPSQSVKLFLSQIEGDKTPIQKAVEKLGKVRVKEIIDEVAAKQPNKEWQPKWGEEVEMKFMKNWSPYKFLAYTLDRQMCILEDSDGAITQPMPLNRIRKPLEIHTFTAEQAKQYLAKLHNINVNQIKIVVTDTTISGRDKTTHY